MSQSTQTTRFPIQLLFIKELYLSNNYNIKESLTFVTKSEMIGTRRCDRAPRKPVCARTLGSLAN